LQRKHHKDTVIKLPSGNLNNNLSRVQRLWLFCLQQSQQIKSNSLTRKALSFFSTSKKRYR